jgi:hypothetical protein
MKKVSIISTLATLAVLTISSCGKDEKIVDPKITKTDPISFEEIVLDESGYYNGSDGSGGFSSGNVVFKTSFTDWGGGYTSWTGFSVTNHTDTITPDYSNQYSTIAGESITGSKQFSILYSFSSDTIEFKIPAKITNISIANSTYAYFSMKNGDAFAKKFGGPSGNDPDYFALYLSLVDSNGIRKNFKPIPLADFTYTDNSQDYISKQWENYDLSSAGYAKYLIFSFSSSDTTAGGFINTPTYVCIDNLVDEWEE